MSQKDGMNRAARRAAKKHEKQVARRRAKAAAKSPSVPRGSPGSGWRPAQEGIAGLADRMLFSMSAAALYAEHLYARQGLHEAAAAWLPSRVRALGVDGVVEGLAARGVDTDRETFRALVAEHHSTRRLVEARWLPEIAEASTVHDRDFLHGAAQFLWREWSVESLSDEQAELALDLAERHVGAADDDTVGLLLQLWEAFAPGTAAHRLERADLAGQFAWLAATTLRHRRREDDLDAPSLRALRGALVEIGATDTLDDELIYSLTDALDDIDWLLDDADAAITRHLERATTRADRGHLFDAVAFLLDRGTGTAAQLGRVRDAVIAALASSPPGFKDPAERALADLDQALAARPTPGPT